MSVRFFARLTKIASLATPWHGFVSSSINIRDKALRISEAVAFSYLNMKPRDVVRDEKYLAKMYSGVPIPEMVCMMNDKVCTVEVKRITCNAPRASGLRWQWRPTVRSALSKANPLICADYAVRKHCMVFVLPSTSTMKTRRRVLRHIQKEILSMSDVSSAKHNECHVIVSDKSAFDDD